jgi:hypothetical protein
MCRLMGERIAGKEAGLTHILKGAVMLELACFTPLVGWFLFTPLVMALNTGAAAFALIGWAPKPRPAQEQPVDSTRTAPSTPTLEMSSWSQVR